MSTTTATPSGAEDHRLPVALNARWAGGEADPQGAESAFRALAEAARLAVARWPDFYREPAVARLVYGRDDPPAPAILKAAARAGMVSEPRDGAADNCEVVVLDSRDGGATDHGRPALIVTPDGAPPRLAASAAGGPALDGIAPRRREFAATPRFLAQALLAPPRGMLERGKLRDYQNEDARAHARRFEYEILLRLIGERSGAADGADDAWERAAKINAAASVDRSAILDKLRAEYERADALALAYGRRWRSTLAARSFLLFGVNLLSGLVGTLFPVLSPVTLPVQFAVTALLYLDQYVSKRRRWRGKWIDYRRAAEATRIARFCVLAGAPAPMSQPPSWIDWRLQRIMRRCEPAAPLSEVDAAAYLAYLREVEIDRQIVYHRAALRRFRRLDAHLRRAAVVALLATFVFGALLTAVALTGASKREIPLLGAIGLALSAGPGLYAALNGLRGQLDVVRQAARSARIGLELRALRRTLAGAEPSPALARAAAKRAAEIMHDDVSSWDRVMEIV